MAHVGSRRGDLQLPGGFFPMSGKSSSGAWKCRIGPKVSPARFASRSDSNPMKKCSKTLTQCDAGSCPAS